MNEKIQGLLSFAMIFAFVFLIRSTETQAAPALDLSQPVNINGYDVNVADIVAEDSLLWPLLANFDRLDGDFSQCVADTTALATTNEAAMKELFPWFWNGNDISYGVDTFCYILDEIPTFMASQLSAAGVGSHLSSATTNIWDSSVAPNWHNINGLVFDHELVRIEFMEEIDLLSYNFVMMVLDFANAFDANTGYIALDSEIIQGLKNTGAIITFKNVPTFEDPVILVNGKLNERLISALVYDSEARTVTFNTQHFTSFEVVERSSVVIEEEDDDDKDDDKKKPKIYSAKIEKLTYADGQQYYKVTTKGKNFDKRLNMYLGGRKSVKEHRENKRRATGYFKVSDFEGDPRTEFDFRIFNSEKRKRTYDQLLPITNIPHLYIN